MARGISCLTLLLIVITGFTASCTSDTLELGPNGDSRLREISFKNRTMVPEFSPYTYEYVIFRGGDESILGKVVPYMFHTKFTLNGHSVRMATNGYKLPTHTDLTGYFTNNVLIVDLVAQDGNKRRYKISVKGPEADARIQSLVLTNGQFKQIYTEFSAPLYRAGSSADTYEFAANVTSVHLSVVKAIPGSKLFASGIAGEIGAGSANADVLLSGIGSGTTFWLTNISSDGSTTNVKKLIGTYKDPANDPRIVTLQVMANGADVPYLPRFDYDGMPESKRTFAAIDDADYIAIKGARLHPDTSLSLLINGTASSIPAGISGNNFSFDNVPVSQGDVFTVRATQGITSIDYVIMTRSFTTKPYGFDGNLKNLIRDIHMYKEMVGKSYVIEGVVTFLTHYNEDKPAASMSGTNVTRYACGWFMEDGAKGLYVWSYNGYKSGIKVGHKIRMTVSAAKIWMNMPEVTDADSAQTQILDGGKRYPLHYLDANEMDLGTSAHLGRLMKYSTYKARQPISATFDDNGIGNFDPNKAFKLFIPYTMSLADISSPSFTDPRKGYSEATEFMKEGKEGIFFGPSFLDGDGASIMMKGKEYMIVP